MKPRLKRAYRRSAKSEKPVSKTASVKTPPIKKATRVSAKSLLAALDHATKRMTELATRYEELERFVLNVRSQNDTLVVRNNLALPVGRQSANEMAEVFTADGVLHMPLLEVGTGRIVWDAEANELLIRTNAGAVSLATGRFFYAPNIDASKMVFAFKHDRKITLMLTGATISPQTPPFRLTEAVSDFAPTDVFPGY